jgi:hypothetical protein
MRRRTTIKLQVMFGEGMYKKLLRYSLVGVTYISANGPATISRMPKANKANITVTTNKPLKIAIHWLSPLHHKGSVSLEEEWERGRRVCAYGSIFFQSQVPMMTRRKYFHGGILVVASAARLLVPRLLAKTSARWNRARPRVSITWSTFRMNKHPRNSVRVRLLQNRGSKIPTHGDHQNQNQPSTVTAQG